jgi:two-component system chemotaxis response regulator CheY
MKRCLVIDDAVVIRRVAARILEQYDIAVEEAHSGSSALIKCGVKMPDAILLDWHMPEMDGLEFLRELRDTPGGDMPKVLLCGTINDASHVTQARRAGADAYMLKPFDQSMVIDKFRDLGLI